jgi:hypothetical protein
MFVEGIPFLIAVFAPLMYLMVLHLMSRQMPVVKTALMKMIGHVKKYGYAVAELLTDGEGAVMALESDLNNLGINLNGTARESVPLVNDMRPLHLHSTRRATSKDRGGSTVSLQRMSS